MAILSFIFLFIKQNLELKHPSANLLFLMTNKKKSQNAVV
jgi:hypothetical protein